MCKKSSIQRIKRDVQRYVPEIVLSILFLSLWFFAWSGAKPYRLEDEKRKTAHYISYEERTIAASAMQNAIIGTLTATSIILAACAAVIGLYTERDKIPEEAKKNFKAAATFGIASIFFAVINLALVPAQVNTANVVSVKAINLFAVLQFLAMLFSAWRLMLAIRKIF